MRSSLIVSFQKNDGREIERFYNQYRKEFVTWAVKSFRCSYDEAIEIFQQSMIIFYENVRNGRIKNIESNSKTYLFAIGKNKIYEKLRAENRQDTLADSKIKDEIHYDEEEFENRENRLKAVEKSLEKLGDPCRHILQQFYYHKASMEDIAQNMNYKNAATVKNLKYKCLQRLKNILNDELQTIGGLLP